VTAYNDNYDSLEVKITIFHNWTVYIIP